jgi:hypothetical protein
VTEASTSSSGTRESSKRTGVSTRFDPRTYPNTAHYLYYGKEAVRGSDEISDEEFGRHGHGAWRWHNKIIVSTGEHGRINNNMPECHEGVFPLQQATLHNLSISRPTLGNLPPTTSNTHS